MASIVEGCRAPKRADVRGRRARAVAAECGGEDRGWGGASNDDDASWRACCNATLTNGIDGQRPRSWSVANPLRRPRVSR